MSYMIEGRWRGYTSSQDCVVHRTYGHSKKFAAMVEALGYAIYFTDGTALLLTVAKRRAPKKYNTVNGYGDLIRRCAYAGVNSVSQLYEFEERLREKSLDIPQVAELHAMF